MNTPLPMSDIAKALASKDGSVYTKKINDLLDLELSKLERKKRAGLDKAGFEAAKEQALALNSAKLVIKSIALFHSQR